MERNALQTELVTLSDKKTIPIASEESFDIVKTVMKDNGRKYFRGYVIAFVFMILTSAATAFPAYLVANIVNDVFVRQDMQAAIWISILVFLAFTVRGFANYGYLVVLGRIANNIVANYQRRVFNHLLGMGVSFFRDTRSAYLVGQINQNILGMKDVLNQLVTVVARDLLTLIGLIGVMIYQDPMMSIASVTVLPLLYLIISRYVKRVKKVARQEVDLNSKVTSAFVENSQGIDIVKAFTMENQMRGKIQDLTAQAENRANMIAKLNAKTKPPTEILAGFAIAAVVAFGGWRVAEQGHDAGKLFSFLTAAMLAYDPARKLASFRVSFERSLVNARMLYELLDLPQRQADKPNAKPLEVENGKVDLDGIRFAYSDGETVIDGISLTAEAGKTTALVGPSGSGKSTIISLIQRFFDLQKGKVLIDGQDISDVTANSLRSQISYVSQQPVMFEGSIRENIRYGKPDATDQDIEKAAELAQAHQFICDLANGYDTEVGEMGSNLSGGQRQRISIARAILRDAPILLLDEATSALDNESEKLVQSALDTLMEGRTTIVVAHRLSTIKNADIIAVLRDGKIIEKGSHDDLMGMENGFYARLYKLSDSTGDVIAELETSSEDDAASTPQENLTS